MGQAARLDGTFRVVANLHVIGEPAAYSNAFRAAAFEAFKDFFEALGQAFMVFETSGFDDFQI